MGAAVGHPRRRWHRHGYLAVSLVLTALYPVLSETLRAAALVSACGGAMVCVAIGRRAIDPARREPWTLLLWALATYVGANALLATTSRWTMSLGQILDGVGNLLALAAALTLVLRRGARDLGGITDAAVIAFAAGSVLWVALPHRLDNDQGFIAQLDLFVVVFALSGVLGALLRLVRTATGAGTVLWWLLAAISLAIVGNITSAVGGGTPGAMTLSGTIFMGTFTAIAMFGLDPSAPRLVDGRTLSHAEDLSVGRLIFLGAAVAAVPGAIGVRILLDGNAAMGITLTIQGALVSAAVMVRIGILARQHSRAQRALAHQATHDPLTQLPNRRELVERLRTVLALGAPCALLFCDLDDFKSVNDHFGHDAGDRLLIEVADELRAAVPEPHVVSRFGGDEFVILLVDVSPEQAQAVRDRVVAALDRPFAPIGGRRVAISIGVALTDGERDLDQFLRAADSAMYEIKSGRRAGRSGR